MHTFQILILTFLSSQIYGQNTGRLDQLQYINYKVIRRDTLTENICGSSASAIRLTGIAKTRVQLTCNYGDPDKNIYDTVENKLYLFSACDPTGTIYDSIIAEIKNFMIQKEAFARKNNYGTDSNWISFDKSFFINDNNIIPFINTGSENKGDYLLYYLNKHVYKIQLVAENGLGSLSSFAEQNMYFTDGNKEIRLGHLIQNFDSIKKIIATGR